MLTGDEERVSTYSSYIRMIQLVWYIVICIIEKLQSLLCSCTDNFNVCKSTEESTIGDEKAFVCLSVCLSRGLSIVSPWTCFLVCSLHPSGSVGSPVPKASRGFQDHSPSGVYFLLTLIWKSYSNWPFSSISKGMDCCFSIRPSMCFPFIIPPMCCLAPDTPFVFLFLQSYNIDHSINVRTWH